MKKLFVIILLAIIVTSCGIEVEKSSNTIIREKQEKILKEQTRQLGLPAIVNFQEKL